MRLRHLPGLLGCKAVTASDLDITAVTEDSRRVVLGGVFVAAPGARSDGHDYVARAVEAGAIAVIGDRTDLMAIEGVPYFCVAHPRKALGILAHALVGNPSRDMTVIGITGTNGKSSSIVLTQRVLSVCGFTAAAFGTLGYDIGGTVIEAPHTTPFGEDLAGMFRRAKDAGQTHVVMEVSSHALEQERVAGIDFDVAAFTNLTQDHLDYHSDMEAYRQAKLKLFERIEGCDSSHREGAGRFTVVNKDDPSAEWFIRASKAPCYTYGHEGNCRARLIRTHVGRTTFVAKTPWGRCDIVMRLLGRHNVSNALGVIAICGGLGLPLDKIAEGIASLECVPGRFEHVDADQDFQVIVDYAHTEDGLKNVLSAARAICTGRVIVVFGCGGDRDKTKRPKMAAAVARLGDVRVITSDNPRTEDPLAIIADVEAGMTAAGKRRDADYRVIPDRRAAIEYAISEARPGDLVMIAGKGHEDYQIIGTEKIHFDDRETAREILRGI